MAGPDHAHAERARVIKRAAPFGPVWWKCKRRPATPRAEGGYPDLVSPYRDGLFHLTDALGPDYPAGLGYFDWPGSGFRLRSSDLVLDPGSSDAEASTRIIDWLPAPQPDSEVGRTYHV